MATHKTRTRKKNTSVPPVQNQVQNPDPQMDGAPVSAVVVVADDPIVVNQEIEEEVAEKVFVENEELSEQEPSLMDRARAYRDSFVDWGFSVVNRVGATGTSVWSSGKNAVNASMAFAGNYVPTPVANGFTTAWKTVSAGMTFVSSYLPSRVTVANAFNNIAGKARSIFKGAPVEQQADEEVDSLEQQVKKQVQQIVDARSKQVSDLVANGTSILDLYLSTAPKGVDVTLVQQYFDETLKSLKEGKKPYISIIQEVNGEVTLMHVSVTEFLNTPASINLILDALLYDGSTKQPYILSTTSEEAVALTNALNGHQVSTLIRQANAQFPQEPQALSLPGKDRVASLNDLIKLVLTSATVGNNAVSRLGANVEEGLSDEQVNALVQKMTVLMYSVKDVLAAMNKTNNPIGVFVHGNKPAEPQNAVVVFEGIEQPSNQVEVQQDDMLQLTYEQEEPVVIVDDTHVIESTVTLNVPNDEKTLDLTAQEKQYNAVLAQLEAKIHDLMDEAENNTRYEQVLDAALVLHGKLNQAAKEFFAEPSKESLVIFKQTCRESIKEAEPAFGEHRNLWFQINSVIRGIFGVFATLTLIPALVVAATSTHGYYDTFFGKPVTKSATDLALMTSDLDDNDNEIEQTICAASAA